MSAALLPETSPAGPFRVETIADPESFRLIGPEWSELLAASGSDSLFLTWEWMFTWWRHLSGRRRLSILAVRSADGRLIAIAPLAIRPPDIARLAPFRTLEFLGTGTVGSDYLDLILRSGFERPALHALVDHLSAGTTMLDLAQIRKGTAPALHLAAAIQGRGWALERATTSVCPYIDLSAGTWDSYLAGLGPAHRYNLQRRTRNLARTSGLQFTEAKSDDDRREYLGHLIELHNLRWQERGGSQAFKSALIAFHDDFSDLARRRGWLRLFLLRSGDRPVAALYGFRYGRTFYFYQSGFHPAHARQSVGLVLMGLTIQRAFQEGAGEFDLLHGDESYKFLWTRQFREIDRVEIYPPRARGAIRRGANGIGRGARRLARRALPRALAEQIAAVLLNRREETHTC